MNTKPEDAAKLTHAEHRDMELDQQVCPACGGAIVEIRAKRVCSRCHTICETCCEGGRE